MNLPPLYFENKVINSSAVCICPCTSLQYRSSFSSKRHTLKKKKELLLGPVFIGFIKIFYRSHLHFCGNESIGQRNKKLILKARKETMPHFTIFLVDTIIFFFVIVLEDICSKWRLKITCWPQRTRVKSVNFGCKYFSPRMVNLFLVARTGWMSRRFPPIISMVSSTLNHQRCGE